MPITSIRWITRTGLLLALTIAVQSLRFVIPVPPFMSTLVIGTLVNSCLLTALLQIDLKAAAFISTCTPIIAYLQQLLPIPLFILPVAAGNLTYAVLFYLFRGRRYTALGTAAFAKFLLLLISFTTMLTWVSIPPAVASGILFVMSWPQLVTAVVGGLLAIGLNQRLSLKQ